MKSICLIFAECESTIHPNLPNISSFSHYIFDHLVTHTFNVESDYGLSLIGKHGASIKRIRKSASALMRLTNEQNGFKVEVTADPSSAALCMKIIDLELAFHSKIQEKLERKSGSRSRDRKPRSLDHN
ncbi:hypothetical protein RF11_12164 [Thelohanellus kitauei]|uniref:K Homology domain-containing protein n=1 Tax=Thelohanellus kitauei TaxID=669202 RepID=A0A0C2MEZ6_THEKT|nr:hypothetical protein RF11_12164 [Thelohanellus kitauei]